MAARMQHQHLHAHHERGYVTEVSIVYVTAGDIPTPTPSAQGGSGAGNTAAVGSPLRFSAQVTSASSPIVTPSSSAAASSIVYPHRSQRPNNQSSSTLIGSASASAIISASGSGSTGFVSAGPSSTGNTGAILSTSSSAPFVAPTGNLVESGDQGSTSSAATPSSTTTSDSAKHGLSAGAGVGIALLVIALVAAAGGLALWYWRKKHNGAQAHQRLDDEKSEGPEISNPNGLRSHVSVRRNPNDLAAPRLSLRPVTDMFPAMQEKQAVTGAATLAPVAAEAMRSRTPEPAHVDSANPFGDDAATQGAAPVKPMPPLGDSDPLKSWPAKPTNAALNNSTGRESPSPTSPPPTVALGPAGATRGSPGAAPNNVHRVQLDFKPTMDDELELKAGQLVRMLHEYDDGWALCIRLDRSQQGVIPRNCISKLPVKPRAPGNGPPPGQRGASSVRPMGSPPMNGPQGRSRAQSSAVHSNSGRPSSPGPFGQGQYGPDGRPRSNSSGSAGRRMTPPAGQSPLDYEQTSPVSDVPARKPVPGQAM